MTRWIREFFAAPAPAVPTEAPSTQTIDEVLAHALELQERKHAIVRALSEGERLSLDEMREELTVNGMSFGRALAERYMHG